MEELIYLIDNVLPLIENGGTWLIAYLFFKVAISYGCLIVFLVLVAHTIKWIVRRCAEEGKLQEIRDTLQVGCSGTYTEKEHKWVLSEIDRLKKRGVP